MSEVCATEAASDLDSIAAEAWALELPSERRRGLRCHEAAVRVDGLLARFARGRGALDVAIGEGLLALGIGDRALQLGYSGIGDYAREQLGIAASTAHKMARLARGLRDRPLLREAVWTGEVTARQAETVLPLACGDEEASWVARARSGETVRALKAAVKAATGAEAEQDEAWERVSVPLSPEARPIVEKALELAGKILGATAPKWQRIEAICNEYLGAHGQTTPPAPGSFTVRSTMASSSSWNIWSSRLRSGHFSNAPSPFSPRWPARQRPIHCCSTRSCAASPGAGGSDDPWNLVSLCAAHHLHGVHKGWIRVHSVAPDGLVWEIGARA